MNSIKSRLASLRRRLWLATVWRGLCGIAVLLIGGALLVGLLDYGIRLPALLRALALAGLVSGAVLIFLHYLMRPLLANRDDLSLALRVEDAYPELTDSLASSVQFLEEEGERSPLAAPSLRQLAIDEAVKKSENYDFNRVLKRRGVGTLSIAAFGAFLAAWYCYHHDGNLTRTALFRLVHPFGGHTWTVLALDDLPHPVAQGQPLVLKGEVTGVIPTQIRLELEGTVRSDKDIGIKLDSSRQSGTFVAPLDVTQQKGKFKFRLFAGDAVLGWRDIEVLPPPRLAMLDGLPSPQVALRFPDYTDLPPQKLSPGQGHIDFVNAVPVVAGTQVTVRAAVDRKLAEAWFELRPEGNLVDKQMLLGFLGHAPLEAATLAALGQSVAGRTTCQLDGDNTIMTARFLAWLPGSYKLHFRDTAGLAKEYQADMRILADPAPVVHLQRPGTSQSLLPDAKIHFKMAVEDEVFAVKSVFLEYRRKDTQGLGLDESVKRVPLSDPAFIQAHVPRLLQAFAGAMLPGLGPRLRPRRLEIHSQWPLAGRFKEGDVVVLQVVADDFNNLFIPSPQGRSHEIELYIVGKGDLTKQLDEDFAKIQQELVRLQHLQEDALKAVEHVQKNEAKSSAGAHDKLVEAAQIQKQIQERVGARQDEGLRKEIANLQQKMRDNQLPPSQLQDRLKTLTTELDRLMREDLQQIELKLSEARKEMLGVTKPAPRQKSPLDQAQALQQDAKKTLDELSKYLNPWATLQQVKGKTRELIQQQQELKKDTEALLQNKDDLAKEAKLQAELAKKAESQNALAQQFDKLMDLMKEVGEKQKDTDTGKKVQAAAKIGAETRPKDRMQESADSLKAEKLNDAKQKQAEAVADLQKMLAALEKENRDEEIEGLRKKQKEARDKLDKITEEMEGLRKKVQDANKIADPQERADKLKKLARDQDALKEKAQEQARELARLQAQQASKDLARAAQEMDRAARMLDAGENPEELQQEALDRMEDAQADLEMVEEELAREQLARIADRLKGLKTRQEAAVAESERIHREVVKKQKWSQGLLKSLNSSGEVQDGLGQETDSLKEKLKDAPVFAHILERARQSMKHAAEAIKDRAADKDFVAPLEKDELAEENKAQQEIARHQNDALRRLERLLQALKDDPALAKNEPQQQADAADQPPPVEPQGLQLRGGDGIPPMAQLKALREEQVDVKERTKDFAQRHPDPSKLNEAQQAELDQLRQDQARIQELFNQLTTQKKEEQP